MTVGDALLDAFIDANILFLIGYALWLLVRAGMQSLGLKHAFGTSICFYRS